MKKTAITLCLSLLCTIAGAQISFKAEISKDAVMLEEPFEVTYEVNVFFDELILPKQEEFEYLAGPIKSTRQTTTIQRGEVKKDISVTYTYIFRALVPGKIDFQPAQLNVKEEYFESDTLPLIVINQRWKQKNEIPPATEGTTGI